MTFSVKRSNGSFCPNTTEGSSLQSSPVERIPARKNVARKNCWRLSRLFPRDSAWDKAFARWKGRVAHYRVFRGRLGDKNILLELLEFDSETRRIGESLNAYAELRSYEDLDDPKRQSRKARFDKVKLEKARSFIEPEILALPETIQRELLTDSAFTRWHRTLSEIFRCKPYLLSPQEEKRWQEEKLHNANSAGACLLILRQMEFGTVQDERGKNIPLTHNSYFDLLFSADRSVRKRAFERYYAEFQKSNTQLSLFFTDFCRQYSSEIRAHHFPNVWTASLFNDQITPVVYQNLVDAVHKALPTLHRYYEMQRRALNLEELHFYDTYASIFPDEDSSEGWSWDEAVERIEKALAPLGEEYVATLKKGLTTDRWVDRYENIGKKSGEFCYPCYDSPSYIVTNFPNEHNVSPGVLAHEGGHAMHALLSSRKQPFELFNPHNFLIEIPSEFNQRMLNAYQIENASDRLSRAEALDSEIGSFMTSLFRQMMFSEFEQDIYSAIERDDTTNHRDAFPQFYRNRLRQYYGPQFVIDDVLEMEYFTVDHLFSPFYVYKYVVGFIVVMILVERVRNGGEKERLNYFQLLEAGDSIPPLELLHRMGVHLEDPEQIRSVFRKFEQDVAELESLLFDPKEGLLCAQSSKAV